MNLEFSLPKHFNSTLCVNFKKINLLHEMVHTVTIFIEQKGLKNSETVNNLMEI